MSDDMTLYGMAEGLLEQAIASLRSLGRPVPQRQVIYVGQIPADCEQIAVVFGGWNPTPLQDGMVNCLTYRWSGDFTVLITRSCVPLSTKKGGPPAPSAMSKVAQEASMDAEALIDLVANLGEHGGTVTVLTDAPQGGLHTTALEISLPSRDF